MAVAASVQQRRWSPAALRRLGTSGPRGWPLLAVEALDAAEQMDTAASVRLAARARRMDPGGSGHSALALARWTLLGRLDAQPDDVAVVVALGLLAIAAATTEADEPERAAPAS